MKQAIIFFIALFFSGNVFAQIGVKGGINFSNITTSDNNIEELKAKIGFQGGLMFKINITDNFALQPEALYTRKGAKYQFFGADVVSNMDYLDIPVLIVVKPFALPLQLQGGVQFSYLLSTEVKYDNVLLGSTESYPSNKEDFEDFDLGLNLGVGITLGKSILEVRYTQGFKEFEKEFINPFFQVSPSSKHFNLQASLGIFF